MHSGQKSIVNQLYQVYNGGEIVAKATKTDRGMSRHEKAGN
jgi:hypothetical protein